MSPPIHLGVVNIWSHVNSVLVQSPVRDLVQAEVVALQSQLKRKFVSGLGSRSRLFLAARSRSRLRKKPGAAQKKPGAGAAKIRQLRSRLKKKRGAAAEKKIAGSPALVCMFDNLE